MDIMQMDRGTLTLLGSGFCTMLTMYFTVQLLSQHLFYWKKPKEKKAIIIIILMAPIYAIDAFAGSVDIEGSQNYFMFLASIKECYEGLPRTVHLDRHTLKLPKYWTWQFAIIRPILSILMIVLQLLGLYTGWISWVFSIILNFSVSLALYSLVVFYHVFAKELAPHKPLPKFLCVKGIVFFCFWQGVVLDILASASIIRSHHFWLDVEHIEEALQNVLICLEMVIFSVMQQYAYHVHPYTGEVQELLRKGRKAD